MEEEPIKPSFPTGRIKKIVKLDKDITRISSEALHLIAAASELFLRFLADKSAIVAAEKKRKTVKIDHLVVAVKRHRPAKEFLLDELVVSSQVVDRVGGDRTVKEKGKGKGKGKEVADQSRTRRIDSFFKRPVIEEEEEDDAGIEDVANDIIEDDVGNEALVDDEIEEEEDVPDDTGNEALADDQVENEALLEDEGQIDALSDEIEA